MYYTIVDDPDEEYFIVGDVHGSLDQLVKNYDEYCANVLANLQSLTSFAIEGDVSLTLSQSMHHKQFRQNISN